MSNQYIRLECIKTVKMIGNLSRVIAFIKGRIYIGEEREDRRVWLINEIDQWHPVYGDFLDEHFRRVEL